METILVSQKKQLKQFGNAIWHPRYRADWKKVEGVLCRATKVIPELKDKSYQKRLQNLNFNTCDC